MNNACNQDSENWETKLWKVIEKLTMLKQKLNTIVL